ncbi:MAG: hypothetical protein KBF59_08315 [Ignavibacterium sp.]|nr:hypothetical protein [Ignavibacterium sp.]
MGDLPKCFICGKPANATGSHIVPAWLIAPCVGERDKEESYRISINSGQVDAFYGSANKKNNENAIETEIKEHHYTLDNIFCSNCEKKLGVIEGNLKEHLICSVSENANKSLYSLSSLTSGIPYKTFLKANLNEYLVFWYSIVYRWYIYHLVRSGCNQHIFNVRDVVLLRKILKEFIMTGNINDSAGASKSFRFFVISKLEFDATDPRLIGEFDRNGHNEFYSCQFIIEFYAHSDNFDPLEIPYNELINSADCPPTLILFSNEQWVERIYELKKNVPGFLKNVGKRLAGITNQDSQKMIQEYQEELTKLKAEEQIDLNHFEIAEKRIIKKYALKH